MNRGQPKTKKEKLLHGYAMLLVRILLLTLFCWFLFSSVFLITQMKGMEMFPALRDGDLLIAYRLQHDWRKGDVVIYRADGQRRVGRIAARETDWVEFTEDGALWVNGTEQSDEILFRTEAKKEVRSLRVPEGCVFILGDKRDSARDSRDFGSVPVKDLEGKLISLLRRRGL